MRKNSLYFLLLSSILILALYACEYPFSAVEASENILPEQSFLRVLLTSFICAGHRI